MLVRFSHLGDKDFGIDEILHVYVAQELLEGNPPVLPSGHLYDRSLPYSYLVTVAGFFGGFSEFVSRIPSALLGVGIVFFVYWMTKRWFSANAGLIAAFLTALSPIEIAHSREVRMYMIFQLLFILTVFFFYEGFETARVTDSQKSEQSAIQQWFQSFQVRPFFLVGAGVFFLLANSIHSLILPAVSGLLVYVLAMGSIAMFRVFDDPLRQKYLGSCLLLLVGGIAVSLIFPEKVAKLMNITEVSLAWGQENAENWSYYRWLLLDEYPIVFGGLTLLFTSCLLKDRKIGLYITCMFLVPLLLHSLVFPMKSYRYILHILPFMYMAAGVGFAWLLALLWQAGNASDDHEGLSQPLWRVMSAGVILVITLGMLINMPWFMRTLKDYANNFQAPHVSDAQHHNWRMAIQYISQHQSEGDIVISGYPLLSHHYGMTQPLYFMNNAYLLTNENFNLRSEQGTLIDYTFGVPVLKTVDDLKALVESNESGWVMAYQWRKDRFWTLPPEVPKATLGTFSRDVLQYLGDHLEAQHIPDAPYISVWRWSSRK